MVSSWPPATAPSRRRRAAPLALLDQLGFEAAVPIPGHVQRDGADLGEHHLGSGAVAGVAAIAALGGVLVVAEMLGQLSFEPGLEHLLGQRGEHPVGSDQVQALLPRLLDEALGDLTVVVRALPLGVRSSGVGHQLSLLAERMAQPSSRQTPLHR